MVGPILPLRDEREFLELVAGSDRPAVLIFYRAACPDCLTLAQQMHELAQEYEGSVLFYKVDFDAAADLAAALQVDDTPTVVICYNGRPHGSWVGVTDLWVYRRSLNTLLSELARR
jgi:thioredoxin-like negative regulator of GroEL